MQIIFGRILRWMNWVGGARSRVRQQNEKKLQKEFFEKKRLIRQVKRKPTGPPSSPKAVKYLRPISQDLMSLMFAQEQEEEACPRKKPMKVNLQGPRPMRGREMDLQLPMSPIAQPSSLDLEDMSVSSVSLYPDHTQTSAGKHPQHQWNSESHQSPRHEPIQGVVSLVRQPLIACVHKPSQDHQTIGIFPHAPREERRHNVSLCLPSVAYDQPHIQASAKHLHSSQPQENLDNVPLPMTESLFPALAATGEHSHPRWSIQSLPHGPPWKHKDAEGSIHAAESFNTESLLPMVPEQQQHVMNPFSSEDNRKKQRSAQPGLDTERPILFSGKNKPIYSWEEMNWYCKKREMSEGKCSYDRETPFTVRVKSKTSGDGLSDGLAKSTPGSSLEEEPLFKWQSNESKIVASGHHMMNSTWSSTVERTLLKPHLVPKKTDTTGILHHASDKEEPVSPVGVAEKKGHSAYEMMINSLEEQASTKDGKWNNDCCAAQGTGVDGTGTSMDQEHCWMKFVCGVDSGPAGSMPSSPPAVVPADPADKMEEEQLLASLGQGQGKTLPSTSRSVPITNARAFVDEGGLSLSNLCCSRDALTEDNFHDLDVVLSQDNIDTTRRLSQQPSDLSLFRCSPTHTSSLSPHTSSTKATPATASTSLQAKACADLPLSMSQVAMGNGGIANVANTKSGDIVETQCTQIDPEESITFAIMSSLESTQTHLPSMVTMIDAQTQVGPELGTDSNSQWRIDASVEWLRTNTQIVSPACQRKSRVGTEAEPAMLPKPNTCQRKSRVGTEAEPAMLPKPNTHIDIPSSANYKNTPPTSASQLRLCWWEEMRNHIISTAAQQQQPSNLERLLLQILTSMRLLIESLESDRILPFSQMGTLSSELAHLQEQISVARSNLSWQSLMKTLHQIDQEFC